MANLRAIVYPQLRAHPHFGPNIRRLPDWEPPLWCFRVGAWTFFYEIDEPAGVVFMVGAQHRAASY